VFFSFPMFTALLSWVLRIEPVHAKTVVALALGTAGVASIFTIRDLNLEGPILALLGALAVSVYYVGTAVVMKGNDPLVAAFWTAVGASVSVLAIGFATGQDFPLSALPWAAAIGIVTATAFAAMYGSIARIGAARSAVAQMLEPVVTVVLGLVILDEQITLRIAGGRC
jgi:drug/metabolite transporter (DMT)-like permease